VFAAAAANDKDFHGESASVARPSALFDKVTVR